jgi:hypothetical protein
VTDLALTSAGMSLTAETSERLLKRWGPVEQRYTPWAAPEQQPYQDPVRVETASESEPLLLVRKDIKSTSPYEEKQQRFLDAKIKRFYLQALARELLKPNPIGMCIRVPFGRPEIHKHDNGIPYYKNLITCGQVWVCPVCAAKISARRQQELARGIRLFDGTVFMATFTMQHNSSDNLKSLVLDLNEGYKDLKVGKWWQNFERRWGIVGSVAALELTHSDKSGDHPHKHTLFFSILPVGDLDRAKIRSELSEHFTNAMSKHGRYVSAQYGVRVEKGLGTLTDGDEALKLYVGKWGLSMEITHGMSKGTRSKDGEMHYSPWEMLELAGEGNGQAKDWWLEYAKAIKGTKQLVWSHGLRERLGLPKTQKTDIELSREEQLPGDTFLAQLTYEDWRIVLFSAKRAELLAVAYKDGADQASVMSYISELREDIERKKEGKDVSS